MPEYNQTKANHQNRPQPDYGAQLIKCAVILAVFFLLNSLNDDQSHAPNSRQSRQINPNALEMQLELQNAALAQQAQMAQNAALAQANAPVAPVAPAADNTMGFLMGTMMGMNNAKQINNPGIFGSQTASGNNPAAPEYDGYGDYYDQPARNTRHRPRRLRKRSVRGAGHGQAIRSNSDSETEDFDDYPNGSASRMGHRNGNY